MYELPNLRAGVRGCLGKGAALVPCAMSRMSDTTELAVGSRPAPCPTRTVLPRLAEPICTALVAPLMEASVLEVGTKQGETKAESRSPSRLKTRGGGVSEGRGGAARGSPPSRLATPSSLTVPPEGQREEGGGAVSRGRPRTPPERGKPRAGRARLRPAARRTQSRWRSPVARAC